MSASDTILLRCAVSVVLVGCGGGNGGPGANCGTVQPCGGDIGGGWNMVAVCEDPVAFRTAFGIQAISSDCPTQSVRDFSLSLSGSFVFNSDLTYTAALTVGAVVDVNVPAQCLAGTSCTTLTANLRAAMAAGTFPNLLSVSCSGTADCVCHEVNSVPMAETGSYSIAGTALTLAAATGTTNTLDYCVNGDIVHLMRVDTTMTMGTMGAVKVNFDYVGVRQ